MGRETLPYLLAPPPTFTPPLQQQQARTSAICQDSWFFPNILAWMHSQSLSYLLNIPLKYMNLLLCTVHIYSFQFTCSSPRTYFSTIVLLAIQIEKESFILIVPVSSSVVLYPSSSILQINTIFTNNFNNSPIFYLFCSRNEISHLN